MKGLYGNTEITTLSVEESRPARNEGEEDRTWVRHIIMLKVTLSKNPDQKMRDSAGFQDKLADSEIQEF